MSAFLPPLVPEKTMFIESPPSVVRLWGRIRIDTTADPCGYPDSIRLGFRPRYHHGVEDMQRVRAHAAPDMDSRRPDGSASHTPPHSRWTMT
ncbi:MAG: hypothetical protein OXQ84_19380 [bacterium]|nr:hypothetical protein [bacterium]